MFVFGLVAARRKSMLGVLYAYPLAAAPETPAKEAKLNKTCGNCGWIHPASVCEAFEKFRHMSRSRSSLPGRFDVFSSSDASDCPAWKERERTCGECGWCEVPQPSMSALVHCQASLPIAIGYTSALVKLDTDASDCPCFKEKP